MYQYELVLENQKIKTYEKISWMAVAINFFAFLFIAYKLNGSVEARWPMSGAALIGIFTIFYFIRRRLKPGQKYRFSFPLFFALFTWIQSNNYWFAAAIVILIVLEEITKKPLVIKFSKKNIHYPSIVRQQIGWQELNNVILKDGLLTMDFKNNRLLQALITNTDVNEETFNQFTKEQILPQDMLKADR